MQGLKRVSECCPQPSCRHQTSVRQHFAQVRPRASRTPGFPLDEFERSVRRIAAEPGRWRKIRGEDRKLNFRRFPYAIIYSLRADALTSKP